ncbi:xanthine dehydrogenase family protein subunit M [Actinocorallia sp. A-T 12471]|uniref:FAD binding domain-containing protein n=1 Tax=Actinocorallia sp. A-T 12471 TaxID=3089813 RepID=UPI0029D14A61|nr:xanthine dehydrogenase family protein subunit M [Actinocorallia sp. A-T 12471]MDX6744890.1 xanthine dehydrogenase family protein subunit M [Actinocorallia sp. A-T 12471]
MKPPPLFYHAPETAAEAVALLADLGDEAKLIAGGQSLVPMLALRLAVFGHLVDLRRVAGVRGIERRDGRVWIGAATTQAEIGRSATVARYVPLLTRATPLIGHFQIRNRGTLGGSIAHADAAAEYPAVALALDAELETLSPRGSRTLPASAFFTGMWTTLLEEDELLTGVTFPERVPRSGYAVAEFARRSGDFAIAGAAVAVELDADGLIERCGIGMFGLGPTARRATAAEADLTGRAAAERTPQEVAEAALAELGSVPADLHASADYRRHIGGVMVARAWKRAVEEAGDV